jgi:hypothetical protein
VNFNFFALYLNFCRAVCPVLHHCGSSSVLCKFMWDLWRTNWKRSRFYLCAWRSSLICQYMKCSIFVVVSNPGLVQLSIYGLSTKRLWRVSVLLYPKIWKGSLYWGTQFLLSLWDTLGRKAALLERTVNVWLCVWGWGVESSCMFDFETLYSKSQKNSVLKLQSKWSMEISSPNNWRLDLIKINYYCALFLELSTLHIYF